MTHAPPRHWFDLADDERTAAVVALGQPAFRARQLSRHLLTRLDDDPSGWTDLPADARESLAAAFAPRLLTGVRDLRADRGATVKTLWRLAGGVLVESVIMRYPGGRATVCVSSQAGCGMGCPFCATGQGGLRRNLSAGEIVAQVVDASRRLRDGGVGDGPGRLSNVVFMGMGEPLANYDAVVRAIRVVTGGLGVSARGLTVSTVGLVPRIGRLAGEGLPVTLAISLHAPDDELRDELCPINKRWGVDAVLDAARSYFDATGRRVSVEYALIRDVNDQAWRAQALARALTRRGRAWAHVNIIPLNPTKGSRWTASAPGDEAAFLRRLADAEVPVTVRDTRGRDIDGACGQLAGGSS